MTDSMSKSESSRVRILDAAAKAFRSAGFGGTGVDGLARGANLTSGAFYFHFKSKLDVFISSLRYGIEDLRNAVVHMQEDKGSKWLATWVDYYLGFKRTCELAQGCSFPVLTPEVERAGDQARQAYEEELTALIRTVAAGLTGRNSKQRREKAVVLLAMLSGGVNMARAVRDPQLSEEIARAVRKAALSTSL